MFPSKSFGLKVMKSFPFNVQIKNIAPHWPAIRSPILSPLFCKVLCASLPGHFALKPLLSLSPWLPSSRCLTHVGTGLLHGSALSSPSFMPKPHPPKVRSCTTYPEGAMTTMQHRSGTFIIEYLIVSSPYVISATVPRPLRHFPL